MFCEKCGKPLSEGALFCRYCGSKVSLEAANDTVVENVNRNQSKESKNNKSKKKRVGLIFVVVAILVILAAIFVIPSLVHKKPAEDVSRNEEVDANYADIERLIQGYWYVEEKDGTCHRFAFRGDGYTDYEYNLPDNALYSDTSFHTDGQFEILQKGELTLYDTVTSDDGKTNIKRHRGSVYYVYDENADSIELTYDGISLSRDEIEEK